MIFYHGVERWIEVADEIGEAIAVGVGIKIGRRVACGAPAHLEAVGQPIAVGIGSFG